MRRGFLMAGIAAGAVVLFTTAAVSTPLFQSKSVRLQRHLAKVQDIAFCHKGYEIASSFPHYAINRAVTVEARIALMQKSDALDAQKEQLGRLLRGAFKERAADLGMDEFSYDNILAKFEIQAEKDAVASFQSVKEPDEFLNQLDETCAPYIN